MYAIEWKRRALKQLSRFESAHQQQIVVAVRELKNWPNCQNVKALRGRVGYRLRVGRYRVFFEVQASLRIIDIEEVKKRGDHTY